MHYNHCGALFLMVYSNLPFENNCDNDIFKIISNIYLYQFCVRTTMF